MGLLFTGYGDLGQATWSFEPSPFLPTLDVAIVDYHVAGLLVENPNTRPDAVLSFWDWGTLATETHPWTNSAPNALVLEFDDVEEDKPLFGYVAPTPWDVRAIIAHAHNIQGRTLIHCAAGISRSSAAAVITFATQLGPGKEREAVRAVLHARQRTADRGWRVAGIAPNRRMIAIADEELGRDRALIKAVESEFCVAEEWRNR